MRPPTTGTKTSRSPRWWPAGETSATSQRWKKKRLVKRPISRRSARATNALGIAIATAISEIGTRRERGREVPQAVVCLARHRCLPSPGALARHRSPDSSARRPAPPADEGPKRAEQGWSHGAQLGSVGEREPGEDRFAATREPHDHLPAIPPAGSTPDETPRLGAVDELDRAVGSD